MNYRHAYHAGNFADVFKHIILIALTQSFLRKESACCYLDTHAGIGQYDLHCEAAQKNKEFETGIKKIFLQNNPPLLIMDYLNCVKKANPNENLRFYPGSPFFVKQFLRPIDRMVLSELHPIDYETLKKFFGRDKQVATHHQDAYQSLKAFLPPKEKRGFVLIDPPYEKSNELMELPKALTEALKKWERGVFAVWYPIKTRMIEDRFLHALKEKINQPMLIIEMSIYSEKTTTHLNGSGMVIINPPWQLNEELKKILPWLWNALSVNHQGSYTLKSINL